MIIGILTVCCGIGFSASGVRPANAFLPDLRVTGARVACFHGLPGHHELILGVENTGNQTASGFSAGCRWDCPGGTIHQAGAGAVQGGYLVSGRHRTYSSPFRIQCEWAPAFLTFWCEVDGGNAVEEY